MQRTLLVGDGDPSLSTCALDIHLARKLITPEQHKSGTRFAQLRQANFGKVYSQSSLSKMLIGGNKYQTSTTSEPTRREIFNHRYYREANDYLIKNGNELQIPLDGYKLVIMPDELILTESPAHSYVISTGNNIIAGVNTFISEELKQEGLVRDLIRQVQNLRKDSGLKVEDRIEVGIHGSKELNDALQFYESYFMNEVLGVKLDIGNTTLTYNNSVKINGHMTVIGITLAN